MKKIEKYEANDGRLFDTKEGCLMYENLYLDSACENLNLDPDDVIECEEFKSVDDYSEFISICENTDGDYVLVWKSDNPEYDYADGFVFKGLLNNFVDENHCALLIWERILKACNKFYKKNN